MDLTPRCGHEQARCHKYLDFIITVGQTTKKSYQGSSPDSKFLKVKEYWNSVDLYLPVIFKPWFSTLRSLDKKKEAVFLGQTRQWSANFNTSLHNNILPIKFSLSASLETHHFKICRSCKKKYGHSQVHTNLQCSCHCCFHMMQLKATLLLLLLFLAYPSSGISSSVFTK